MSANDRRVTRSAPLHPGAAWHLSMVQAARQPREESSMFCILYGASGRTDYKLSTPRASMSEALADYNPNERIVYDDGVLGGADMVELGADGSPVRVVIEITTDFPGEVPAEVAE